MDTTADWGMTRYPLIRLVDEPTEGRPALFDFNDGNTQTLAEGWSLGVTEALGNPDAVDPDYSDRVVTLPMMITGSKTQATSTMSTLARVLRDRRWLHFKLSPDTPSIWLRTYRGGMSALDLSLVFDSPTPRDDIWQLTATLDAEPEAVSELVTYGPLTVPMNPGLTGLGYIDMPVVRGDCPAPLAMFDSARYCPAGVISIRRHGTPADLVTAFQAETGATLGFDTTVVADAALSGGNGARVSFALTPQMVGRVTWPLHTLLTSTAQRQALRGRFRVLAFLRRLSTTSNATIRVRAVVFRESGLFEYIYGDTFEIPMNTNRQMLELGEFALTEGPQSLMDKAATVPGTPFNLQLQASSTGSGITDMMAFDCVRLIPCDEGFLAWSSDDGYSNDTAYDTLVDPSSGYTGAVSGSPFDGSAAGVPVGPTRVSGKNPEVIPGGPNRVYLALGKPATVTLVEAITLAYRPRWRNLAAWTS